MGWALAKSPCLPAFLPVPLGADQATYQGLIDVFVVRVGAQKSGSALGESLQLLVLVELEQTRLQGRGWVSPGLLSPPGTHRVGNSQQQNTRLFPSGCVHDKILIPFYGETGEVGSWG